MTQRKVISLSVFFTFLAIGTTGVLMYLFPHVKSTASIHTLFGFIFLILIGFHIKNNWKAIMNYLKKKTTKIDFVLGRAVILLPLATLTLVFGVAMDFPAFNSVYNWGNEYRNSQEGKKAERFEYEVVQVGKPIQDKIIELEFKQGPHFQYPTFALWAEDLNGKYLQTLYVSKSIATSVFEYGKQEKGIWKPDVVRRPEALPRWSHKRGIKAKDGLYVPEGNAPDLDGYTGATPLSNALIETKLKSFKEPVKIFFEINQSFDWNEYFSKDRFPEDNIYSGSGQVGQPAIVYSADVSLDKPDYYIMRPVGHSHHSGKTGELFEDLSKITTALKIVDRVLLTVK